MNTITTATRTLKSGPTTEEISQVQAALEKLVNDPEALMLARLQLILNIAETDIKIRAQLHVRIQELVDLAHSSGHEVF